MKWSCRFRCVLVCVVFTALFSVFSCRLVYLQMVCQRDAEQPLVRILSGRGSILDATGQLLALNLPNESIVADATLIKDIDKLVEALAAHLDLSRAELGEKLSSGNASITLKTKVPLEVTAALRKTLEAVGERKCITFKPSATRVYPNGPMLCHVLGFMDGDGVGVQGIEASMEPYLHGVDGYRYVAHDRKGSEIATFRGDEKEARDGYQVHLTIDANLQNIVEKEIDAAVKEYTPEKATIILMQPQTGEILAMANRPNFDPNELDKARPEGMKNRAISDQIEPGSTFKVVTAAAALDQHKVQLETMINCENGAWSYGGRLLHDHGSGYSELSMRDVLVHSSNIGAAKLALSIGEETFYKYILGFGFGTRTGIELPGEIRGIIRPPHSWSSLSITRIPMGHEIGVTPLQMTVAMAAIANGGNIVTPRIVKSITDRDGRVVAEIAPHPLRRVINRETAEQIGMALRGVVSDRGTAAGAAVPGFISAGKTGTAQKINPDGSYDSEKTVVSFSGFMPAENPAFVCFVVLDDPHTKTREENYGGKIAGPIYASIGQQAALCLSLQPHEEVRKALAVNSEH